MQKADMTPVGSRLKRALLCLGVFGLWSIATGVAMAANAEAERIVARVGAVEITESAFLRAYQSARRARYYHGTPPDDELEGFRAQVLEDLVSRVLLLQEADDRGIVADGERVDARLEHHVRRMSGRPGWKEHRETLVAFWETVLDEEDRLAQLESEVRGAVMLPDETSLERYRRRHADKFTEPATQRVSLILLPVPPSSPSERWEAARQRAGEVIDRLRRGEDFAELARQLSADSSASQGGDMGYLHRGMLSGPIEQAIASLEPGEIAEPVTVLEGVAVLRLEDRRPERTLPFSQVRQRVAEHWTHDAGERAWQALIDRLRAATSISVDKDFLRS